MTITELITKHEGQRIRNRISAPMLKQFAIELLELVRYDTNSPDYGEKIDKALEELKK